MRRRARRATACATMQAELGLSGRAAGQRMRGRVLAGLVPGALRLEGVAPFGAPVFILVADGTRGTLLLSRERRVVAGCRAGGDSQRARRHQARARRSSRDAERLRAAPLPNRQALARTAPIGSPWISRRAERSICGASGTRGGSWPGDTAGSRSTTRRSRAIARRRLCCAAPI